MAKIKLDKESLNQPVEKAPLRKPGKIVKEIKPPAALKPGTDWDAGTIEITSEPLDSPNPDWDAILKTWGYDPQYYEIVEPVKVSQWDAQGADGIQTLWSYKAGVKTRVGVRDNTYTDLVAEIKKHKRSKITPPSGDDYFVVCLADWQLAKADGDGTVGTVKRILDDIYEVEDRIKALRKAGRKLGTLVVAGLGDMIENCEGNYSTQTFTVELNRREQIRVARRLIRDCLIAWSKLFEKVIVVAVPGNHGENRSGRFAYTTDGDNDDVGVFEQVCDIFSANPEVFGHVEFAIPEDEIWMMLDLGGTKVGFVHGHITTGGGKPQDKIERWWKDLSFGESPIGDANILVSAHYHHFYVNEQSRKVHIGCPANDGGSKWWEDKTGQHSRPGTLTFVVDNSGSGYYKDLEIV